MFSPLEIQALLELYSYGSRKDMVKFYNRNLHPQTREKFQTLGLIHEREMLLDDGCPWELTDKGMAHVQALKELPLPECVWVTPRE